MTDTPRMPESKSRPSQGERPDAEDRLTESFEVVGDPETLPDAFFDAMACWLLDIEEADELQQDDVEEEEAKSKR